ncbi:hypothetical protein CDAR_236021 [Caerostris darwini]|uniref:Uncharacterized protein n=1 Tax=Caerostris darwini TaxID=1538125 RepID=A0AAV4UG93_9ARAC|nr:hypothetical protein CDAR_236021 [Caerostris darwini]
MHAYSEVREHCDRVTIEHSNIVVTTSSLRDNVHRVTLLRGMEQKRGHRLGFATLPNGFFPSQMEFVFLPFYCRPIIPPLPPHGKQLVKEKN